jgi:hypothetical protein
MPTSETNIDKKYVDLNFIFFISLLYRSPTVSRFLIYFLDLYTICRTPWTSDRPIARPLPKYRTTQTQKNAHTRQKSMPEVGFEPMITAFERAKTVHALDRSATVIGLNFIAYPISHIGLFLAAFFKFSHFRLNYHSSL